MCAVPFENLSDKLVEYVLDNLSDFADVNDSQIRIIKAMKLTLQERREGVWEFCVGMGMSEATFSLTGEKRSGAIGGAIERLITQWLSRPFNQEAIKNLLDS